MSGEVNEVFLVHQGKKYQLPVVQEFAFPAEKDKDFYDVSDPNILAPVGSKVMMGEKVVGEVIERKGNTSVIVVRDKEAMRYLSGTTGLSVGGEVRG